MADSIGDLKISILLEVYQAEQNAGKITTTLKTIETQGKKTTESVKDISSEVKNLSVNAGTLSRLSYTSQPGQFPVWVGFSSGWI